MGVRPSPSNAAVKLSKRGWFSARSTSRCPESFGRTGFGIHASHFFSALGLAVRNYHVHAVLEWLYVGPDRMRFTAVDRRALLARHLA